MTVFARLVALVRAVDERLADEAGPFSQCVNCVLNLQIDVTTGDLRSAVARWTGDAGALIVARRRLEGRDLVELFASFVDAGVVAAELAPLGEELARLPETAEWFALHLDLPGSHPLSDIVALDAVCRLGDDVALLHAGWSD
ncbi:MAG: hypothetical protein KIT84_23000 [Labilithrix sp.]|nr:hypothetical protein [Labilithrix sp.]MCW5813914.1 hypothetical protein [Labilithrix sp.]